MGGIANNDAPQTPLLDENVIVHVPTPLWDLLKDIKVVQRVPLETGESMCGDRLSSRVCSRLVNADSSAS